MQCCERLLLAGDHLALRDCDGVTRAQLLWENLASAKDVMARLFDSSVAVTSGLRHDPDFAVTFDNSKILPIDPDEIQSSLVSEIDSADSESLLLHPLIESFIYTKWQRVKYFFYGNVLCFLLFVVLHSMYVDSIFKEHRESRVTLIRHWAFRALHILAYSSVLGPELVNFVGHPRRYLRHAETINYSVALVTSGFVVFSLLGFSEAQYRELRGDATQEGSVYRSMSAVSVFACWTQFMMLLGRFPILGTYVLMFSRVAKKLCYFVLAFSSLVVGFALTFRVLFYHDGHFHSFFPSVVRTLMMLLGEMDYGDLVDDETPFICYAMLVIFSFLVCILLANLLIGLAVDDIAQLQNLGRIERLTKQISYIATYEKLTRLARRYHLLPRQVVNKLDRLSSLAPSQRVFLNDLRRGPCLRQAMPDKTLEAALAIHQGLQEHQEPPRTALLDDPQSSAILEKLGSIETLMQKISHE